MASEFIELDRAVAQLRADVSILENTIQDLKKREENLMKMAAKSSEDMVTMRIDMNDRFNNVHSNISNIHSNIKNVKEHLDDINICIDKLEGNVDKRLNSLELSVNERIDGVDKKLDKVSGNTLLEFTSDIDAKKIFTIIAILISLVTSPGLVTNFLASSEDNAESQKLDLLIELLQEQETNEPP